MTRPQTKETVIDGYKVELELYEESGEPRSDCFIHYHTRVRHYNASLACLQGEGVLDCNGFGHIVHPQTIAAIEKWAEDNGY